MKTSPNIKKLFLANRKYAQIIKLIKLWWKAATLEFFVLQNVYLFLFRSCAPIFEVIKTMAEKLSSCHGDIVLKLNDLIKDLGKYSEEQKGKHKQVSYFCY